MKAFDTAAEKCRAVEGFVKKEGPALRTRFDRLVRVFRAEQRASLRSSGTTEEHEERDVLLQDIVCRMDNWKEKSVQEKAKERSKIQGIESSGELMRRLAMEEVEDEEEGADRDDVAVGEEVTAQDEHPRDIQGKKSSFCWITARIKSKQTREARCCAGLYCENYRAVHLGLVSQVRVFEATTAF